MKFIIKFLLLLLLVNQTFNFKLLALGDIGQVDKWWLQNQKLRIISFLAIKYKANVAILASLKKKAEAILALIEGDANLVSTDGVSAANIFTNFHKIYQCSKMNHDFDAVVLLGDGLYTEHKGGLIFSSFKPQTETADFVMDGNLVSDDVKGKKRDIYYSFQKVTKKLTNVYEKRMSYGIKKMGDILKAPGSGCGPTNTEKSIAVLPGNHSFDIDMDIETNLSDQMFLKTNSKKPNLSYKQIGDIKAWFLDINLMEFACLDTNRFPGAANDDDLYLKCILKEGGSRYLRTPEQARAYLALLVARLVELKFKANTNWRIIRTHNPLYNPEVDSNAVLQQNLKYKCNGKDLSSIWEERSITEPLVCVQDATATAILLTTVFKKSLADFWLASHYHASLVIAAPFIQTQTPDGDFQDDFIDTAHPEKCIDKFNSIFGLVTSETAFPRPSAAAVGTSCKLTKTIYLKNEGTPQKFLLTFVIGNSGRYFDPLKNDAKSNGEIAWGRSNAAFYVDPLVKTYKTIGTTDEDFSDDNKTAQKIDSLGDNLLNSKSNIGWTLVTLQSTKAIIEFYELGTNGEKEVISTFTVEREGTTAKTHFIEKWTTAKVIPGRKRFLKK